MKLTNFWKALSALCSLAILISFTSCEHGEENIDSSAEEAESIAIDEAIADDLFEDIDLMSDEAAAYEGDAQGGRIESDESAMMGDCVGRAMERKLADGISTKVVTLDFQEGCEGPQGREREGTMIITRVADANASTYTVSTAFQDFYLDGKKIEGVRTRVYTKMEAGVHQVQITLTEGKVTLEDGREIERSGAFTKTWNRNSGETTVEGSASGINRNGVAYTSEIIEKLLYKRSCFSEGVFMAVQGTRSISREGKADVTVDYGQGECDKTIDVTVDGESRTLELSITKKN